MMQCDRRNVRAIGVALCSINLTWSRQAFAAQKKTIDRRVFSEAKAYGLIFAAKNIDADWKVGHAFVVWQSEDDDAQMSRSDVIGFYPSASKKVKSIFGPGGVQDDAQTNIDLGLVVLVNSDRFDSARAVKDAWKSNGTYTLGWSDCVGHVDDIAATVGLKGRGMRSNFRRTIFINLCR